MTDLTLISHPLCPYVQRAVISLTEKAVPFKRIDVDLSKAAVSPDYEALLWKFLLTRNSHISGLMDRELPRRDAGPFTSARRS